LKKEGAVLKGKGPNKADAILSLKDADFIDLASGKLNGKFTLNVNSLLVESCWC
jgi:putative sterol carrier protein